MQLGFDDALVGQRRQLEFLVVMVFIRFSKTWGSAENFKSSKRNDGLIGTHRLAIQNLYRELERAEELVGPAG